MLGLRRLKRDAIWLELLPATDDLQADEARIKNFQRQLRTNGLNVHGSDCKLPNSSLNWKTFYPLVDTKLFRLQPKPFAPKFTTVGQWYWGGAVEVAGEFPDLSKKLAFDPYLDLPTRVPDA